MLERQCPDCAFDAASVVPRDIGMTIRDIASQWEVLLLHPASTKRPVENVWSPSEYGCHVRDVFRLFDFRLELMLTEDDPMFPNWDQDETAISDRYDLQDPLVVRRELAIAGDLLAERFDAVTLVHVLEHLDDPAETLRWIRSRMNTGGALIVAVPNYESPDARHYGAYWAAWDVPIHYWHFTKEAVSELAKSTGWFVAEVRPMRLDAFYVSLLSESYKTGVKNWFPAIYQGIRSNILGGRKNASSLIYVLRKAS